MSHDSHLPVPEVERRIHLVRGRRIVLDKDLATLYGVTTYRLNEQVKRNQARFPEDFLFQLSEQEVSDLRSQNAISSQTHGGRRSLPYAFTEHGAIMAATVLNSPIAVEASIVIVRAFIHLREMLQDHADLRRRLQEIESRLAKGFEAHEQELQEIRFLIAQLQQPVECKKPRIGF